MALLPNGFDTDSFWNKDVDNAIEKKTLPKLAQFKFQVGDKIEYYVVKRENDGTFYKKTGKITKTFSVNGKAYYQIFPKPYKVSRMEEAVLSLRNEV